MAGIYIHIPFCKQACHYCNFHFSTNKKTLPEMVAAICMEAEQRKDYLDEKIHTIYFGGGTPSMLSITDLEQILRSLGTNYDWEEGIEITLEANPDDINVSKLNDWKALGITRLSIGIQSFFDEELKWMNRAHLAKEAMDCIQLAQLNGFNNLSIDLIYGTFSLSDEGWRKTLEIVIATGVPHLSCYALTVEPKTAMFNMIEKGKIDNVDPDKQARHFEILTTITKAAGYEQYEISNFSLPGFRSRHNSSYWQGEKYLGLGPSAHSYNGISRQWNVSNNALYLSALEKQGPYFEIEYLTPVQHWNEYIMTSLRTIEGISIQNIREGWGETKCISFLEEVAIKIKQGFLIQDGENIVLTAAGKFLADGIASDLFLDEIEKDQ